MATRATYSIQGVTFYIHWDGYPTGAAVYLWNMHNASSKGGMAEAFLRANEGAEFTPAHDAHGDTEYRYTIEGDTLTAEKRVSGWDAESPAFDPFFVGNWWEFVNANADMIEHFEPLASQPDRHYVCNLTGRRLSVIRSGAQLVAAVDKASRALADYVAKFPTHVGNISGLQSELARAIEALTAYGRAYPRKPNQAEAA